MASKRLTESFVKTATAEVGAERSIFWDEGLPGFGLMVTSSGHRSFVVQYRSAGISRRMTFDGELSLKDARKEARAALGAVAKGHDPLTERRKKAAETTNSLKAVAEEYFSREGKRLRSIETRRAVFRRYILPRLGLRQIDSIKRSEIVRLLDAVEDEAGAVSADYTLAALRRLMTWHASRDDDFLSPIVRGMARTKPKERARDRVLSDVELRAIWRAAEARRWPYSDMLRFILLTATRLREAAEMRREELSGDEWLIPAARYKGKHDHLVPLSQAAQAVLAQVPVIGRKGWVFTTSGEVPISGFSKAKRQFDALALAELRKLNPEAKPLPRWTTHDLRRTARSLMSRAGVDPDHAERALGHVINGVRGTYDRHEFKDEKRRAFETLAAQIDRIINPQQNVMALRAGGQGDV
jgi:site-specific recombinase XerD